MGGEGGRGVDMAGRKEQDPFFGGLSRAHDAGRCYRECEDGGQKDLDHSTSITTRPL